MVHAGSFVWPYHCFAVGVGVSVNVSVSVSARA